MIMNTITINKSIFTLFFIFTFCLPYTISSSTLLFVEHSYSKQNIIPTNISLDTVSQMVSSFEGFSDTLYYCQGGKPTIGYGTLVKDTIKFRTISKAQATKLLTSHLSSVERQFIKFMGSDIEKLNKYHKEALLSLIYNIGIGRYMSSKLAKLVRNNPYDYKAIEKHYKSFRIAGGKISNGLIARRAIEWSHYIKGGSGEVECYTERIMIY